MCQAMCGASDASVGAWSAMKDERRGVGKASKDGTNESLSPWSYALGVQMLCNHVWHLEKYKDLEDWHGFAIFADISQ